MSTRRTTDEVFHSLIQRLILWAAVMFWLLEAYMNARFGWRTGGIGLGGVLLATAIFAAYLPLAIRDVRGGDTAAWIKRLVLAVPLVVCVIVSQVAGWATLGTTLADGLAQRQTQATVRSTAVEALAQARAEREAIGVVEPIGAIRARRAAECARTSARYPDGDGPLCKEWTAKLATAEQAEKLETQIIPELTAKLQSREQVAEGTPHLDVLVRGTGVDAKEVAFWVPVALTAVVGLFANFGFLLAGVGKDQRPAYLDTYDSIDWGPTRLPPPPDDPGTDDDIEIRERPVSRAAPRGVQPGAHSSSVAPGAASKAPGWGTGPATSAPVMHGAPINITVQSPSPGADRGTVGLAAGADVMGPSVSTPASPAAPAARALEVIATAPAPDAPVDRDPIRALTDGFLVFQAACLVSRPGGRVSGDDLYTAYVAHHGERAEDRTSFDALFGSVTGLQATRIGGVMTWRDVALKSAPVLALAGSKGL